MIYLFDLLLLSDSAKYSETMVMVQYTYVNSDPGQRSYLSETGHECTKRVPVI